MKKKLPYLIFFHQGKDSELDGKIYSQTQVEKEEDLWSQHPASLLYFPFSTNSNIQSTYQIYTDGSLSNDTVGAAYVILNSKQELLYQGKFKLPTYATILDAELTAIKHSLLKIMTINEKTSFTLYTDSLSSLQAISNPYNKNKKISEIKTIIHTLQTKHELELVHVRSHTDIFGNDLADHLANQARHHGEPVESKLTKSQIKKEIKQNHLKRWNEEWRTFGNDSEVFHWIPSVYHIPDHFPSSFYSTQLVTGHGRFPYYFKRFKITSNTICPCGLRCDSFNHYLQDCRITRHLKPQIAKLIGNTLNNANKPQVLKNSNQFTLLTDIVKLICDTTNTTPT